MYEQIFDTLRQATTSTLQMQQEMYKKFTAQWPGMPMMTPPAFGEQAQQFQKKWAETGCEMVKKQREILEGQFAAGLQHIEEAFQLAQAKDIDELRAKTIELWKKSFECLQKVYEAQIQNFQSAVAKWSEFAPKVAV